MVLDEENGLLGMGDTATDANRNVAVIQEQTTQVFTLSYIFPDKPRLLTFIRWNTIQEV